MKRKDLIKYADRYYGKIVYGYEVEFVEEYLVKNKFSSDRYKKRLISIGSKKIKGFCCGISFRQSFAFDIKKNKFIIQLKRPVLMVSISPFKNPIPVSCNDVVVIDE